MANVPTDPPVSRTIDYGALVKKLLGDDFHKHEEVYRFSNGRKMESSDYGTQGVYRGKTAIDYSGTAQDANISFITLGTDANGGPGDYVGHNVSIVGLGTATSTSRIVDYTSSSRVSRVVPPWGTLGHLSLPGSSGNYASTPDSAAVSIVGDIDLIAKVAADDWTPSTAGRILAKRGSDQFSYDFGLNANGTLHLFSSADGTNQVIAANSTVAVGASNGSTKWVRVTVDVDNGASGSDTKFWTSDDGTTWTQLGTTVTTAGATSFFDGTADLWLGGLEILVRPFDGKIYYAEVRNGIGGAAVAKFDPFNDAAAGATSSFVSSTGETWTINTSGSPVAELSGVNSSPTYSISPTSFDA